MNEEEFRNYLKKGGRSPSVADRVIKNVLEFQDYLDEFGKDLDQANTEDLDSFITWIELTQKRSAKTYLWAIRYYYQYSSNSEMEKRARDLRQDRIKRIPFALRKFRDVNPDYIERLSSAGIRNIEQILEAGKTRDSRKTLADKTGVPQEAILEYVKLSDIARIPGMKGIRARLYYDAGVDTVAKMSGWDPDELRIFLEGYVENSGFDGIPPLPKEVEFSVETAKKLPYVVEY